MAAYAALLSLFHTLNQINNHPFPPISLDQSQVEFLTQNLTFLQHFLERYPSSDSQEDDDLESRITDAAYAVEDVIEFHVVDQIHAASTTHDVNIFPVNLHQALEGVIGDMDLIKTEVMHIIKDKIMTPQHHPHLHTNSSTLQSSTIPVFDGVMINQVLDKLVGQQSSLQIIPIVGMGGIGKTTFATNIYTNPLIVQHFDALAWITISQEYSRRNILQLLCQGVKGSTGDMSKMSEDEIGLILYQHLWGRRYFIVLDDIWSVEAWDKVKSFFPDDNNGSRVMVTTRFSNLASELSGCHDFQMQFLDEDKSWDLLCGIVFGKVDCPVELENIGKEIAKKCRGLPLSIAVTGGLLKKSNMTGAYWMYTLENLNSFITLEKDEYALRVLHTSYKELPIHLKPCFLYMGIFPEDNEMKVSVLIKLWIAEGILRPIDDDKSFEEVGKEYLKELTDRNLILVSKLRWDGEAKLCKMHDMLRGLCLREAQKKRFFRVNVVEHVSLVRSFFHEGYYGAKEFMSSHRFRLVRVYSSVDGYNTFTTEPYNDIFEEANLRYLSLRLELWNTKWRLLSLCSHLWNLQTIKVDAFARCSEPITVSAIWEMPQIRHVMLPELVLPEPPDGEHKYVLENLQTLGCVKNFKFSEEAVKRIQNVKKLKVKYEGTVEYEEGLPFCLNNLGRLQKLESFHLAFSLYSPNIENIRTNLANLVSFRHSLKKLSLSEMRLTWEDMNIKIGSLPLLQHLTLSLGACVGPYWETIEGKFCNLKFLKISSCADLKYWDTDSAHFPRLEHLLLDCIYYLEEIPSSIGDIPTLKSIILLEYCSTSANDSARRIKKEQKENGNEDLQVIIDGKVVQVDSDEEDQEDDEFESDEE